MKKTDGLLTPSEVDALFQGLDDMSTEDFVELTASLLNGPTVRPCGREMGVIEGYAFIEPARQGWSVTGLLDDDESGLLH